ncbi:MAG: efflux RND transporter periplasmic adaptor subunit [Acidobacteria bacterium]|nr:efflux RND transporter periplasmic adaptor subunit [Acidobacteriota bacterium]
MEKTRVRLLFPLLFILLSSSFSTACSPASADPAQAAPPPQQITTAEVISREVTEWDEFTGRLEAVNAVAIRPRVSGFVSAVRFEQGSLVNKGDLLFEIDPRPFQAEVDRLRAELSRAQATVERANSDLRRAERLEADNAMAPEEHDRRVALAQESAAQVAAVEAALRLAELNLEFTRVTSPISGRVGRAIITVGNLVSSGAGEATLLTTVVSLDPIYASFDADEQTFLRYGELAQAGRRAGARQTGIPVQMALANDEGFPRDGTLDFLDNHIDPETGTIRGRAIFQNPDLTLTPGSFVRLRVPRTDSHPAILIQDRAVGTDLDKRFVWVMGPEAELEYRTVQLGPIVDGLRVVRSGLEPADVIVVNGLQRIYPGVRIDPVRVGMEDDVL